MARRRRKKGPDPIYSRMFALAVGLAVTFMLYKEANAETPPQAP